MGSNVSYFALLKHPLLRPLRTQLLDILKHVEYDVLHMHCKHKRATFTLKTATINAELGLLLTETLLRQVHVDDEEHESTGSFLLPSHQCVHPAFNTSTR